MQVQKYEWRIPSLAHGIDPQAAIAELERIEETLGALTPKNLVEVARSKDNILHDLFEWNDEVAAENYRLAQARRLINNLEVIVVSDGESKQVPVFEIVSTPEHRSYKAITEFSTDDAEQVRRQVVRDISYLRKKLGFYDKFKDAVAKLDEAAGLLGENPE